MAFRSASRADRDDDLTLYPSETLDTSPEVAEPPSEAPVLASEDVSTLPLQAGARSVQPNGGVTSSRPTLRFDRSWLVLLTIATLSGISAFTLVRSRLAKPRAAAV